MAKTQPVKLKDISIIGRENLPVTGGYLLLPSQLTYHDLQRLEVVLAGLPIVFLVEDGAGLHPLLKSYLDRDGVDTLVIMPETTDLNAYRGAMKAAVQNGAVIIYLPADAATLPAPLTTVPGSKLDFVLKAGIPVVPVYVHRLQDTALAVEGKGSEADIVMAFGKSLVGEDLSLAAYQESLLELNELSFSTKEILNCNLGYAILQGLIRHGSRHYVIDGKDGNDMRYDKVLGCALALSQYVRSSTQKSRVGIVLPPGPLGLIANVAVLLAGKTPVN
jgi:acyl-[acyl-carrier-protein]-phospholipid O-acyltransferase/long-chain-fatty-acid--[acyl-carrier-protein] ligase